MLTIVIHVWTSYVHAGKGASVVLVDTLFLYLAVVTFNYMSCTVVYLGSSKCNDYRCCGHSTRLSIESAIMSRLAESYTAIVDLILKIQARMGPTHHIVKQTQDAQVKHIINLIKGSAVDATNASSLIDAIQADDTNPFSDEQQRNFVATACEQMSQPLIGAAGPLVVKNQKFLHSYNYYTQPMWVAFIDKDKPP